MESINQPTIFYRITVAGFTVAATARQPFSPSPEGIETYREFINSTQGQQENSTDILVELCFDPPPVPSGPPLFQCDDSWELHHYRDRYLCIIGAQSGRDEMRKALLTDETFQECKLFVNPQSYKPAAVQLSPERLIQFPVDHLLLFHYCVENRGIVVHSAGGEIQGRGVVFPAVSGGGKSTLSRKLGNRPGNVFFSDDRLVLKEAGRGWECYGTPWPGEEKIACNRKAPLAALFFLVQSEKNEIVKLSKTQALKRLLPVCSIPWYDRIKMNKALDICEDILDAVPVFEFHFALDLEAMDTLEDFITKNW